jgi:hypothetical protein
MSIKKPAYTGVNIKPPKSSRALSELRGVTKPRRPYLSVVVVYAVDKKKGF